MVTAATEYGKDRNPGTDKSEQDLADALRSTAAFVERCDCMIILAPSTTHEERVSRRTGRKAFVCYRTWRRRAFCVLELFASYLSRRRSFPVLLIRSAEEKPKWISAVEAQKLAVGMSNFSCCEMNHPNGMECDKIASWGVLENLIQSRVKYDHDIDAIIEGRLVFALRSWWQRGLCNKSSKVLSLEDFKFHLRWNSEEGDGEWLDRENVSMLFTLVFLQIDIVTETLQLLPNQGQK